MSASSVSAPLPTDQRCYCVIGGGIIGSWTALHLARAGVQTVMLEQFPGPHTRGSSHGASRVTRMMGDDNLAALDYSFSEFRDLESRTGEQLLVPTGLINIGKPSADDGPDDYCEKYMSIVRAGGDPIDWLSPEELRTRYPHLHYPELGCASDPSGAILLAHKCVAAVQAEYTRLGGRKIEATATEIVPDASIVKVRVSYASGKSEELTFAKVAVCAGPWSRKLLPPGCAQLLSAQCIPVTYWREQGDEEEHRHSVAAGMPVLYNARLKNIYSIPSYEYRGLVKVLVHSGPAADPDLRDLVDLQPTIDYVSRYIAEHLPRLDASKPAIVERCMYTMTPDSKPLIDLYHPNVAIGVGFSGSGFKHSPASGHMVASLLLQREAALPDGFNLSKFRVARFDEGDTHSLKDAGRLLDASGSML